MEPNWLDIVDNEVEDDDANPTRRDGTFRMFEFSDAATRLPSLLEQIAGWARECAEYQVVDLSVSTENGWATVAVEVGPRDLHVSRLSDFDCNARLREVANLLQELTDRHRCDNLAGRTSPVVASSGEQVPQGQNGHEEAGGSDERE